MENASKALLIAAGILIVIIIIAVSMKIFNGTTSVNQDAQELGEGISETTKDASEVAVGSLKDINSKNLLNIPDHMEEVTDYYYSSTRTNVYLKPNKTYEIRFDYKVIKAAEGENIESSIGVRSAESTTKDYDNNGRIKTIIYPNQTEGTCSGRFTFTPTEEQLSKEQFILGIRFARTSHKKTFKVYISNVELREVK